MSDFDSILYEVADGRARITLNRPEKLNALSLKLQSELSEALWEADNDTGVHCVIVRGAGRAFSAGYDLTGADGHVPVSRVQSQDRRYRGGRSIDDDAWQLERAQRYRMALFDMHKPSIAQVHGLLLGRRHGRGVALRHGHLRRRTRCSGFRRRGISAPCRTTCGSTTSGRSGPNG